MKNKLYAFVLMPFDKEFDEVYADLIKPAFEAVGYNVKRADDIVSQQNILKDIFRSIAKADLIIADLTSLNANVFYELGIAHTFKKPVIMIAQSIEEVPFDLTPFFHVHYKTMKELQESWQRKVIPFLKNMMSDYFEVIS